MGGNIKTLDVKDGTGFLNNVTELLEHYRSGQLNSVGIVWRLNDKDKTSHVFWNGDDDIVKGILSQAICDIAAKRGVIDSDSYYEPVNPDESE